MPLFEYTPFFVAGAGGEIAVSLCSCMGGAVQAPASALDALVFQHDGAAVEIGLARPDPVAAGGTKTLMTGHRIRHDKTS